MRIEKGKDKIIFLSGFILAVILIILVNIFITKANYRKTESIPLAKGTINYSLADLNIIAMYKEKDEYTSEEDKYEQITEVPIKGYIISNKSYCTEPNNNNQVKNNMTYKKGIVSVDITKKGTKCYIYFDIKETLLAEMKKNSKGKIESFTGPSCDESSDNCGGADSLAGSNMKQVGVYETEDNDGTSYYFRGGVTNNWVKFGKNDDGTQDVWWRIMRINGDGTIRLIYAGTGTGETAPSQTNTVVATNQNYSENARYNDNTYVGFYHGSTGGSYPSNHSNANISNVANQLKIWYEGSNWNDKYNQYIDEDAGFCNDRTIHPVAGTWRTQESSTGRGAGTAETVYGPYSRIITPSGEWNTTQTPTLICGKKPDGTGNEVDNTAYQRDLYTLKQEKRTNNKTVTKGNGALDVPVGLITVDEVIFAGGFGNKTNEGYYLSDDQSFWTMSPWGMNNNGNAVVFAMNANGFLSTSSVYWNNVRGVRPVINLRADVEISGHGLSNDPYVIETE